MNTPWQSAITDFVTYLQAAGRSAGTIRLRRHYLSRMAQALPPPFRVTTRDLLTFLAHPSWSPETRRSAVSAARTFYSWAQKMGLRADNPALQLPTVPVPAGQPRPAPDPVWQTALAGADQRGRLMLKLAAHAGLRCCEIARVHSRDLVDGALFITGKGGKGRRVPLLDDELIAAVGAADGWLFPGRTNGHLSAGHVSVLLARAMPAGWTGHTLRHRFATRAYAGPRDLLAVQELLGHSKPETTRRYTQVPDDALRAAVLAAAA